MGVEDDDNVDDDNDVGGRGEITAGGSDADNGGGLLLIEGELGTKNGFELPFAVEAAEGKVKDTAGGKLDVIAGVRRDTKDEGAAAVESFALVLMAGTVAAADEVLMKGRTGAGGSRELVGVELLMDDKRRGPRFLSSAVGEVTIDETERAIDGLTKDEVR